MKRLFLLCILLFAVPLFAIDECRHCVVIESYQTKCYERDNPEPGTPGSHETPCSGPHTWQHQILAVTGWKCELISGSYDAQAIITGMSSSMQQWWWAVLNTNGSGGGAPSSPYYTDLLGYSQCSGGYHYENVTVQVHGENHTYSVTVYTCSTSGNECTRPVYVRTG